MRYRRGQSTNAVSLDGVQTKNRRGSPARSSGSGCPGCWDGMVTGMELTRPILPRGEDSPDRSASCHLMPKETHRRRKGADARDLEAPMKLVHKAAATAAVGFVLVGAVSLIALRQAEASLHHMRAARAATVSATAVSAARGD